jgi:hypothetical protein
VDGDEHLQSLIAVVPAICIAYFAISRRLNKHVTTERDSANSLVVLSGMLAALAILIPLGATLLPERRFTWSAWLLVGALLTDVLCMFGTIYCMISLQGKGKFTPKEPPYIPSWINATWLALGLLALSSVGVKSFPTAGQERIGSTGATAQARFTVVRDLPELGANRQAIKTNWGIPAREGDSELQYRTKDGVVLFCLDPKGLTHAIIETKETDANAIGPRCK